MCKDHDLQHYSIDLRNLAREICCDDKDLAATLLDLATYEGLSSFWLVYDKYCEDMRRDRVEIMLKRGHTQRRHRAIFNAGEIVNAWDGELSDMIPY